MIAYVTGKGMKPNAKTVQVWKRFRDEQEASDWINEAYERLVTQDRTLSGLLNYGILLDACEERNPEP